MSNHTKEPWQIVPTIDRNHVEIRDSDRRLISVVSSHYPHGVKTEDANAHRIVQAVNACAGMDDPAQEIAQLRADRAELFEMLKVLTGLFPKDDPTPSQINYVRTMATEKAKGIIKRMEANHE